MVILGDRRSTTGLDLTESGERSTERREFCKGEGKSDSDLATPRLSLLTRAGGIAAGDAFLGVSDTVDLGLEDMAVVMEEEREGGGGRGVEHWDCLEMGVKDGAGVVLSN